MVNLPSDYVLLHALQVARERRDLKHFRKYFHDVNIMHEKIHEYLADKIYGPAEKKEHLFWIDDILLTLRNSARDLLTNDAHYQYLDIIAKYDKVEKHQRDYIDGESKYDQDRISHKRHKVDLLLNALLYCDADSANTLKEMRIEKELVYQAKKEKAHASLLKAKAKEFAWRREEKGENFIN